MNVPTVIAVIGGVALLIGIFGGGIKVKEIEIRSVNSKVRVFSIITGVILISLASLLSNPELFTARLPEPDDPADVHPTQTVSATAFTSVSANLPTLTGQAQYSANFEGGAIQGIGIYSGEWQIVDDGTGNHVFQIDNSNLQQWPGFDIGSSISDGIIEYRVKYLDFDRSYEDGSGSVNLYFRSKGTNNGYVFAIQPYVNRTIIAYVDSNAGWSPALDGSMSTMFVKKDIWYKLRMELKGTSISIYLDGALLTAVNDDRYQKGGVLLSVGPRTKAQVDDISITYYEP